MAQKYLTEFYTYKAKVAGFPPAVANPGTPLEQQIHAHVMIGNAAFYTGRYAAALNSYLSAWALLPKTFYPAWLDTAVSVSPERLLSVDMTPHLAAASVRILQARQAVGGAVTLAPAVDPPPELVDINHPFLGKDAKRIEAHQLALAYLQSGDPEQARAKGEELLRLASGDPGAQADAHAFIGAAEVAEGNFDGAQEHIAAAQRLFESAKLPQGIAAGQHNAGVAMTLGGRAEEAGKLFAQASARAPQALAWSVTHSLNPGISSVSRGFGKAGLPLILRDADGGWSQVSTASAGPRKTAATVLVGLGAVSVDLASGTADLQAKLLQPRIAASSLVDLETHYWKLPQFVSYLAHVGGFVLPMALGDAYAAVGDSQQALSFYSKARDYTFLNHSIERRLLWRKMAQVHLTRGNRLYRDRNIPGAQVEYEQILRLMPDGSFQLSGPLYSGGFAPFVAEHTSFLSAPDPLAFLGIEYSRRAILLEARNNLSRILNNINYLGFPEDIVPIHSWRYLQNVARYFANHAIQAERSYITFKDTAEKEQFTRLAIEQAVDAQAAALDVEQLRVRAAADQLTAASLARQQAQVRLNNAQAQRAQFTALSQQLAALEEILAFTNATGLGSDIVISQDWSRLLGISAGTYDPAILVQLLTRQRLKLTQQYELANLDRQIAEMQVALNVANQQVTGAQTMLDLAEEQLELARLKLEQAAAQLEHFNAQEFTPELWDNLAQAQREISRRYLDWAIGAAFLMERAFEFDYDIEVNRIRFDYERSDLNGVLASDYLLADVDAFTFDRIMETEKQVPIKVTVSLADRYPAQFREFQRTGRMDFEVLLQDVDRRHPGTCVRKLKRIEVVVEGIVGPDGLHGTLTNSGITHDRGRSGARKTRVQKPETMVLSQFDLRHDGFAFASDDDVLALFENAGPAGGWILEFPPESNDADYRAIGNVHLIMYFDAFYGETAADHVRVELAATAIDQSSLGLSLRHQYPDEFFSLRDTGAVTFTVDNTYLPFSQTDPRIRDAYLVVETAPEVSNAGLVVHVEAAGGAFSADQTTDANGMIASGGGAEPLNGLRDLALAGSWTVSLREGANAAAFAAGFAWSRVANMYLLVDYEYTPRGLRTAADAFAADPMGNFDVIDDPRAVSDGPSAWSWDAAGEHILQTSSIHGPAGNANLNTEPDKPGSYLVRQTDTAWPELANCVLRCRMSSQNGDGIGLVVRYQDADNFYFLLMDAQRAYRRIGRKVNGIFQELQVPAVSVGEGVAVDEELDVAVAVSGRAFSAYLNGTEILHGQDDAIPGAGRVGLYVWGNPGARFSSLSLREIRGGL